MAHEQDQLELGFLERNQPPLLRSRWIIPLFLFVASCLALIGLKQPLGIWEWKFYDTLSAWRLDFGKALETAGWDNALLKTPRASDKLIHVYIEQDDWDTEENPTKAQYDITLDSIRLCSELGARTIGIDRVFESRNSSLNKSFKNEIDRLNARWGFDIILAEYLKPKDHALERIRSMPTTSRHLPAGLINIDAELDGSFRQYRFVIDNEGRFEASLALACYASHQNLAPVQSTNGIELHRFSLESESLEKSMSIEAGKHAIKFLRFFQPKDDAKPDSRYNLRHLSYKDLSALASNIGGSHGGNRSPLHETIVLVSFILDGTDVGATSIGSMQPLSSLHLNAINQLLTGSNLKIASIASNISFLAIAILSFVLVSRLSRYRYLLTTIWILGIAIATTALFWALDIYLQQALILLVATALAILDLGRRSIQESSIKNYLNQTLGSYFSPKVYQEVLSNPRSLEPKESPLTILISDLRNFTSICEQEDPKIVFQHLGRLFDIQATACLQHAGNLEQIVGDQFMAYWGEPCPVSKPEDQAFAALNQILQAIDDDRASWDPSFQKTFGLGIALHTGSGLVGNKGSLDRMNFGVLGDIVNASSRLESLTKKYGVDVLVTKDFIDNMASPPPFRLIDRVTLKGKSATIDILEPKTIRNEEQFEARAKAYEKARQLVEKGEIENARIVLENPLLAGDGPSVFLRSEIV